MPAYSENLKKDLEEGKVILFGCCVSNDDPFCACLDCVNQIFIIQQILDYPEYADPLKFRDLYLKLNSLNITFTKRNICF